MEGTIGEIRLFAATFAPKSWAYCNGQLLPISSNTALFSILGTTYGGDGKVTFALPQLAGRSAVGNGTGPGLTQKVLGEMSGTSEVTLLSTNLAPHTHATLATIAIPAYADNGEIDVAANNVVIAGKTGAFSNDNDTFLKPFQSSVQVAPQGQNLPVSIVQPALGMNYIVCLYGMYPPRNN